MFKHKVLVTAPIRPKGMEILARGTQLVVAPDDKEETILNMIDDFDAVITRTTILGKDILQKGKKLQAAGYHGVGLDSIDLATATEEGICVLHTPGANAHSVAEFIVALMLALSRHLIPADYAQRVERNFGKRNQFIGSDLQNKVLGIIGTGQVGKRLAKICINGFNMRVLGYDPLVSREQLAPLGIEKVDSLEWMLKEVDFLSLNCPLTEDTRGLIDKEKLSLMKPSAYLINCARGPVVDEAALLHALKTRQIAGAGLDVLATEPPAPNSPILDLPNVIVVPHIASFAYESIDNMSITVAEDTLRVLRGEHPKHLANLEVWEKRKFVPRGKKCKLITRALV
ncbi:MAG: hydroxyacid dehydrogenase [bacterium]